MDSEEKYKELRVAYPGHPYVAVLGRRFSKFGFQRIFNPFLVRRERHEDGRQEHVHHLPDATLIYEVQEMRGGERIRWYAATIEGDPNIYRISRRGAELVASKMISICEATRECPERSPIEAEEE